MRRLVSLSLVAACAVTHPTPPPSPAVTPRPAVATSEPPAPAVPDRDDDGDGVVDGGDRCPGDEETRNGYRDDDGCPDEKPVGRAYFLSGLRGVPFVRPPPLPRAGADHPVGYFFSTRDDFTAENYTYALPDRFVTTAERPRATLALNADTSGLSLLRRFLAAGAPPPAGVLRSESMIDYFDDEAAPVGDGPVVVGSEVGPCPWAPAHRLVRVRVHARAAAPPPRLFVLAIDTSGSMGSPERMPLLRGGLVALLDGLRADDRVALVGFAGTPVALPPTPMHARADIEAAIAGLRADGTQRPWPGQAQARALAQQRRPGEQVHVVVVSDGADLGWSAGPRAAGADAWSVIAVGAGDVDDESLSRLAIDHDGQRLTIDAPEEAQRAFARLARQGPIVARDVQVQATFDRDEVAAYRVVGHAALQISDAEFRADAPAKIRVPGGPRLGRARAGELAAGRGATILYEVVPAAGRELAAMTVQVRARVGGRDRRWTHAVRDDGRALAATSNDFRFSAAVAALALLINGDPRDAANVEMVRQLAAGARGRDLGGDRAGLVALLERSAAALEQRAAEWSTRDAWLAAHPADPQGEIPAGALPLLRFEAMRMRAFGHGSGVQYRIVASAAAHAGPPDERRAQARHRAQAVMRYLVETMRMDPRLFELAVDDEANPNHEWASVVRFELVLPP